MIRYYLAVQRGNDISMEMQDLFNAGSDIMNAVNKAVEANDYSNLGETISDRVGNVTSQIAKSVSDSVKNSTGSKYPGNSYTNYRSNNSANNYHSTANGNSNNYSGSVNRAGSTQQQSYFIQNRVGKMSGLGRIIGGGVGAICTVTGTILFTVFGAIFNMYLFIPAAVMAILTALCAWLIKQGSGIMKLVQKYYQYGRLIGSAEYLDIEAFARKVGIPDKKLVKELKSMMKDGLLPSARMDKSENTLMLTDKSYKQYLEAEENRRQREIEEQRRSKELESSGASEEVKALLDEGNKYVQRVKKINDVIPDNDSMSDKLYRLEEIMNKIFERVRRQPQNAKNLRKFMDYYLPTTTKLLDAYVELGKQPEVGDNITKTKQEIENAMDVINNAFEKLLDEMFQDVAWDISSDISVMKTMMEQDGLTNSSVLEGEENGRGN